MTKPLKHIVLFVASLALGATVVLATGISTASAQTQGWSKGKSSSTPSVSDMIPKMSSDEAYTERYTFAVDLDGGGHIGVDWTVSNLGWGDGQGGAAVRVRLPGHDKYKFKEKADDDEWSYSSKKFDIDIADTRVRARGKNTFVVTHKGDDVSFKLLFKNTTPMWKPGSGEIKVKDGYYKFNMLAPRANVTGEVTIGGKTIKVKGTKKGYADHVATNIAPFDFAKRFSRFRTYNNDVFVMWREIKLHSDYGSRSYTWAVVGYKDKIVFSDPDATIRFARMRKDPKGGYKFPMAIQIDGKDGKDSIKLVMRGKSFKRIDLLENYGAAAKMVASTVSNPYRYDVKCKYTLQMTIQGAKAQVSGNSHFVMDYINE
ncbi:carotenoid 1,2-hydratase [Persicimonas caeni]|uniref:Carotenoid 1,2-hydratase n=1 Tax=Persicimonas caeni TaxID=2292766 RepID=A0A4Y6PYM7_PERCE|nr:carotenoid 1,2-hydratase [Persicimonas caeni]QED34067.1 carotenoid 1,2-hydratase [Persicimonas caeni]